MWISYSLTTSLRNGKGAYNISVGYTPEEGSGESNLFLCRSPCSHSLTCPSEYLNIERLKTKARQFCLHRLNVEVDLQSLFGLHVTSCAQLYSLAETPELLPIPPHWDSYTRALLVSKDRRHLFVTPRLPLTAWVYGTCFGLPSIQYSRYAVQCTMYCTCCIRCIRWPGLYLTVIWLISIFNSTILQFHTVVCNSTDIGLKCGL